jgi:uncharacterized repeat protein (TIGR03803 family)
MQSKKPYSAAESMFVTFITLLLASTLASAQTQATKFKVLHTFKGANGALPGAGLVRDGAGNLYGTTTEGGEGKCGKDGCGTAFKLDKTGKQVWLHSFGGKNGRDPAGLLRDAAGNLYGTTVEGGDLTKCSSLGCGMVFKLNSVGGENVLYKFNGDPDGFFPESRLVRDAAGNLYGTTSEGGAYGFGAVFKVDQTRNETLLYSFTCQSDGCDPYPGVVLDSADNLYGVAFYGGAAFGNSGYGVVFKLTPSGDFTILHTFDSEDGANPDSTLLFDSRGNLYGTTENGGSSECGGTGCGVAFELSPNMNGGSWTESVLYAFCSLDNCEDGEIPDGPLVLDAAGNLYGTTFFGGNDGDGIVFKLDKSGKETVLYDFTGEADGGEPVGGLVMDGLGHLYGTAELGGDRNCAIEKGYGCGVVFELKP